MGQLIREPLVHFLVLGAAIFALFAGFGGGSAGPSGPAPAPVRAAGGPALLEVTPAEARALARQFAATWRRAPRLDELDALIENYIREEVLVREAQALALDEGDAVIRQRLVQKMQFLMESPAAAEEPSEAQLQAHLAANAQVFARPARIAFEQIPVADAAAAAATLAALRDGADPSLEGAPSLLPRQWPGSPRTVVDGSFGGGFFDALAALPRGVWTGPVNSGYGPHLIRVTGFAPRSVPPLDAVRDAVTADWRAERRAIVSAERLDALMAGYEILRPDPAEILGE
jgi:parvulin-like peptidyl-prolyl isomerase